MAVNCAILSYDGTVHFGFSGDVHAAPDLRRLEELLNASFTELREAAGINLQDKKSPPRKRAVGKMRATKAANPESKAREAVPLDAPSSAGPTQAPPTSAEVAKVVTQLIA